VDITQVVVEEVQEKTQAVLLGQLEQQLLAAEQVDKAQMELQRQPIQVVVEELVDTQQHQAMELLEL
jgi:hypothetical protein